MTPAVPWQCTGRDRPDVVPYDGRRAAGHRTQVRRERPGRPPQAEPADTGRPPAPARQRHVVAPRRGASSVRPAKPGGLPAAGPPATPAWNPASEGDARGDRGREPDALYPRPGGPGTHLDHQLLTDPA